jgi:DNA-binding transcriptional ArsR family regulator
VTATAKGAAELAEFDAVFGALAHRARRTILSALQAHGGQMTSGAIAAWFEHSWPTTSQHLRVLQHAGLVTVELRGREHVYELQADRLRRVTRNWLSQFG